MPNPYLGEIRMFGGNFAPVDWALCNGAPLQISQYSALYNLIGTTYGGDGVNTFNLPDLRGRTPIHQGSGFVAGQMAGTENVTLTVGQLPSHTHSLMTSSSNSVLSPANALPGVTSGANLTEAFIYETATVPTTSLAGNTIGLSPGNSLPHDNMQPFLVITFIIALFGIYPSQ
jgi:microcystin-dependent protein